MLARLQGCHTVRNVIRRLGENRHGIDVARLFEHDFHGIIDLIAFVNVAQCLSPIRAQIRYAGNDAVGVLMPLKGSPKTAAHNADSHLSSRFRLVGR
jgi:hypothetical protein